MNFSMLLIVPMMLSGTWVSAANNKDAQADDDDSEPDCWGDKNVRDNAQQVGRGPDRAGIQAAHPFAQQYITQRPSNNHDENHRERLELQVFM